MTVQTWKSSLFLGVAALAAIAVPAQAQEAVDGRWLPFVGCWEPVNSEAEAGLLCFTPSDGGVDLETTAGGEVVATEHLVADGQQRSVSAEGCEGWEAVEFSADGRRAFTRSEFTCGTDAARAGTGVMSFVAPNRWIDVRSLDVEGEAVAWVQAYMLVGVDRLVEEGVSDPAASLAMGVRVGRMAASTAIDLDDVEEAAARMDDKAVETWVAAQQDPFDLSADDLVRLSDNGVPESVIDVVVAVSYPDRFVVEPAEGLEPAEGSTRTVYGGYRGYLGYNPFYGGVGYSRYGYSPFGYSSFGYSPYGYSPFGYYGAGYGGYAGYRPGTVVVVRRGSDGGGTVQNGRGYRRGSSSAAGSAGSARPRSSGSQPSASRGGGSQGTSAGSSRSGSTRSTGRKAKRRGG